jgi:hypothetical protein
MGDLDAERAWAALTDSYFEMLSARRDLLVTDYHSCINETLAGGESADAALRLLEFLPPAQTYRHVARILMLALRGEPHYALAMRVLRRLDGPTVAGLVPVALDDGSLGGANTGRELETLRSLLSTAGQQEAAEAVGRWVEGHGG